MTSGAPPTERIDDAAGTTRGWTTTPAGRPRWWVEAVLLGAGYFFYEFVQARAPKGAAMSHGWTELHLEQWAHLNVERAINQFVSTRAWLAVPAEVYYTVANLSVTLGVLVWLYWWHPTRYRPARRNLVGSSVLALIVFWALPTAPPRLLPGAGFIDTGIVHHVALNLETGSPSKLANLYGAMPSLHIIWALWCAFVVASATRHRWAKIAIWCYPATTGFVVVATANHYVLDLVAGAAVLACCVAVESSSRMAAAKASTSSSVVSNEHIHRTSPVASSQK